MSDKTGFILKKFSIDFYKSMGINITVGILLTLGAWFYKIKVKAAPNVDLEVFKPFLEVYPVFGIVVWAIVGISILLKYNSVNTSKKKFLGPCKFIMDQSSKEFTTCMKDLDKKRSDRRKERLKNN
jgi:hypothetical protein